jgi:hypothetical protein
MSNNEIIILILVAFNINSLIVGCFLGRYFSSSGVSYNKPQSFFKQNQQDKAVTNHLSIDDKKVVVDIKTDGLEKKYDSLGDVKQSKDNISNSINKLKNLKR